MLRNATIAISFLVFLGFAVVACDDGGGGGSTEPGEDTEIVSEDVEPECVPQCEGRECGYDGCGGSCGECTEDQEICVAGLCECKPECGDAVCGDNGCGGSCGDCPDGEVCQDGGCICEVKCEGKECGPDGCGGEESCWNCPADCDACCGNGACEPGYEESCLTCVADCACACGELCQQGSCLFTACEGKECGADGCGGSLGPQGSRHLGPSG